MPREISASLKGVILVPIMLALVFTSSCSQPAITHGPTELPTNTPAEHTTASPGPGITGPVTNEQNKTRIQKMIAAVYDYYNYRYWSDPSYWELTKALAGGELSINVEIVATSSMEDLYAYCSLEPIDELESLFGGGVIIISDELHSKFYQHRSEMLALIEDSSGSFTVGDLKGMTINLRKPVKLAETTISIKEPRRPVIGASTEKEKALEEIEADIRDKCESFLKDYPNASLQVYVSDFIPEYMENNYAAVIVDNRLVSVSRLGRSLTRTGYKAGTGDLLIGNIEPVEESDILLLERIIDNAVLSFTMGKPYNGEPFKISSYKPVPSEKIVEALEDWYNYMAYISPGDYEECYNKTTEFKYSLYENPGSRKTFLLNKHEDKPDPLYYEGFECYLNDDGSVRLIKNKSIFISDISNSEKTGDITVSIGSPDKPDFGTFEGKAGIISDIEAQMRAKCQNVLKTDPGAFLEVYVPDFRKEFLDLCDPIIIVDNKEIIVANVEVYKHRLSVFIDIMEYKKIPLNDFDSRRLDHIKGSAVLHFTMKN